MLFKICAVALCLQFLVTPATVAAPYDDYSKSLPSEAEVRRTKAIEDVTLFLEEKNSPLAEHTEFIMSLVHWKMIISISAIESQYCKRIFGNYNCWGIMIGDRLRRFSSFQEGAEYTNNLIDFWQERGRWLTVEDYNCHYVVPCNQNWVQVVKKNLNQLNELSK